MITYDPGNKGRRMHIRVLRHIPNMERKGSPDLTAATSPEHRQEGECLS